MTSFCRKNSIFNRIIAIAMFFVLIVFCVSPAFASELEGKVDGIKWAVNGGVLSIEGKGKMPDFTEQNPAPWSAHADTVTHLSIDSRITSIGVLSFYDFKSLLSVSLSENVKAIGNMAFAGCENLATLTMSRVTSIGDHAFSRCFKLKNVVLPNTLETLGRNAFYRCESLDTINVPQSVTAMGDSVFAYCKSLVSASIYAKLTAIPEWTFYGCHNLNTLYLSDAVTSVGNKALEGCDVLTYIYHEGGDEVVDQLKPSLPSTEDGFVDISVENSVATPPPSTETTVTKENDEYVRTDSVVESTPNSVIKTETSTHHPATDTGYDEKKTAAQIKIEATVSNGDGWKELFTRLDTEYANRGALEGQTKTNVPINVDVSLLDGSYIYGETLKKLANKRVTVTVTTPNGSSWTIDGTQLVGRSFKKKYNLEYTIKSYQKLSSSHRAKLAGAVSYKLTTSDKLDFPITLRVYIDRTYTNSNATLYDSGFGGSLSQIKTVTLIDGTAEYKMANVNKGERYIVGVNVLTVKPEQVYRPDSDAPDLENYVPVTQQYEITEVRGFMGMTMKQFTIALVSVLAVLAFVVFVVILAVNLAAKKKAIDSMRNKKAEE